MCRGRLVTIGRLVAYRDDAGQHFTFALCDRCLVRLRRLPRPVAQRQENAAIGMVARCPEKYLVHYFSTAAEAHLYIALEAENMRQRFLA